MAKSNKKPTAKKAAKKKAATKRKRITTTHRTRGLNILKSNHPEIRKLKKDHEVSLHGNKFWNSSFFIMDHLKDKPLLKNKAVLEVGCGWGLLSIFCVKNFKSRVTATDADKEVFPYLLAQAENNEVEIETKVMRFEKFTKAKLKKYDYMFGADICFWDELTPVLFKLIKRAHAAGVKKIIIADPGRSPFYELHELCEAEFEDVELTEEKTTSPVRATGHLLIIRQ